MDALSVSSDFHVALNDRTHYITSDEIEEASMLEQKGMQRLYTLSQAHPTLFYVSLPLPNGHMAATEIRISPDLQVRARNPPFRVDVRYVPCHTDNTTAEQSQCLYRYVQRIYNTYIVAIRWIIDEHCCKHENPRLDPDLCCRKKTQSGFDWLATYQQNDGKGSRTQPAAASEDTALDPPKTPTALEDTAEITVVHPQQTSNTRRKRPRVDKGGSGTIKVQSSQPQRAVVENIAHRLAEKVKSGLRKFIELKRQSLDIQARIRDLTKHCLVLKQDKKKLFKYIGQLETELAKKSSMSRGELNIAAWTDWLFSCCLCQILSRMGDQARWRRASAANIILGIVDKLLPVEGINALGVIIGLSVHYHTLRDASVKNADDQERISTLVAYELRGQLSALPDECEIPYPAGWVSMVTQVSMQDVHTCLGISNLAFLGLPPDSTATGAENTDTTSISIRQARQMWCNFEDIVNSEAGRVPRSLDLFTGPDFADMWRAAELYENSFTHSIRQVLVTLESPWALAMVAKEFSRLVNAWIEQRPRVEENMARATLHDLSLDTGAIEHEQNSGLFTSPTAMSMSSSARGTSLGPSRLTPEHDLGSSSLSMLLEAAHQANTPTLGMPQLPTLPLMEASTRVQSPDSPEATDDQWLQWIDMDVYRIGHIVAPRSICGGGLEADSMPQDGGVI